MKLTIDDVIKQTKKHISNVECFLRHVSQKLKERGVEHDATKLMEPELEIFCIYTEKLAGSTYGSDEYKRFLNEMKPALDHHYANNSHHPEHFKNGVDGMNLLDLIEMFCDWKAATMRHDDGNIIKSIEYNSKRFNLSDQLKNILLNSVSLFELETKQNETIEQKRLKAIENVIKIQSSNGNWDHDPYMHGMLNGMLLIESIVTDKKFEPYSAPKRWGQRRWYERIIDKITRRYKPLTEKE